MELFENVTGVRLFFRHSVYLFLSVVTSVLDTSVVKTAFNSNAEYYTLRWLGDVTVRATDLGSSDRAFDSRSGRYQAT